MTAPRRENLVVEAAAAMRGMTVSVRGHELRVDETAKYGGHDSGANPVEHLLAGIATASLVVLRLVGEEAIAESATLRVSARLNVDRVLGVDAEAVFDLIHFEWEVASASQADRLRAALPRVAERRPGQALIDAAASFTEEIAVRGR